MRISLADKLDALLNFRYHPSYWVGSGACCSDVTDLPLSASSNVADYDLSIRQLSTAAGKLYMYRCTCATCITLLSQTDIQPDRQTDWLLQTHLPMCQTVQATCKQTGLEDVVATAGGITHH